MFKDELKSIVQNNEKHKKSFDQYIELEYQKIINKIISDIKSSLITMAKNSNNKSKYVGYYNVNFSKFNVAESTYFDKTSNPKAFIRNEHNSVTIYWRAVYEVKIKTFFGVRTAKLILTDFGSLFEKDLKAKCEKEGINVSLEYTYKTINSYMSDVYEKKDCYLNTISGVNIGRTRQYDIDEGHLVLKYEVEI